MNLFRSALTACIVDGLKFTKPFLYSNEPIMLADSRSTSFTQKSTVRTTHTGQQATTTSMNGRLPPITLASLNESLRSFTQGHIL